MDKMKVSELKAALQKLGLPVSGTKDTLIKRLKESKDNVIDEEKESIDEESKSVEDTSEEEKEVELPEDISKMKVTELRAVLKKRGLTVSGTKAQLVERLQGNIDGDPPPEKKKRKANEEDEGGSQKKKKETHEIDDFTQPNLDSDEIKIVTWNVAGFSAVLKKGFEKYLSSESPDILCLNETKINSVPIDKFPGYYSYFYAAQQNPGYSGVGLLTKTKPLKIKMGIGNKDHDTEGRCITAEYDNFYVVASYIPNSGAKGDEGWPKDLDYRMEWDKAFQDYLHELDKIKPIIWCGDLNVAHREIDLENPKTNGKTAGFTPRERESFGKFLDTGFTDVHRHLFPGEKGEYSFWSYRSQSARENNIGWRLDYFVVSNRILPKVTQSYLRRSVMGSDHCPIGIHLKNSEEKETKKINK